MNCGGDITVSGVPMTSYSASPVGALSDPFDDVHMGVTAENVARKYGISRADQDVLAVESHRRAQLAIDHGHFRAQTVPVLGVVFDGWRLGRQRHFAAHAFVEGLRAGRRGVGLGADAQHRHRVAHRLEAVEHMAADPLRGRVGRQKFGMRGFQRLQLGEQAVVLGVGDLWRVEHAIAVGVVVQQRAQLGGTSGGVLVCHAADCPAAPARSPSPQPAVRPARPLARSLLSILYTSQYTRPPCPARPATPLFHRRPPSRVGRASPTTPPRCAQAWAPCAPA
ncbi:MAG: hypothetical protein IPF94_08215 [Betaproteobacteria bacterium]|nr:hypothetical protein [Betaproteobacteria bacterium]